MVSKPQGWGLPGPHPVLMRQREDDTMGYFDDDYEDHDINFADPGGNSALRAASDSNPRNISCPNCGEPDRLTPEDKAHGYQCDTCANRAERGFD